MAKSKEIIVKEGDILRIGVLGGKESVYISMEKGRLVLSGGTSIIERIENINTKIENHRLL